MITDNISQRTKEIKQGYVASLAEVAYKLFTEAKTEHEYEVARDIQSVLEVMLGTENAKALDRIKEEE